MPVHDRLIDELAKKYWFAEANSVPIAPLRDYFPHLSLESAYQIQHALVRRKQQNGWRPVGWRLYGIHAASLGGIWQILVCGFGGIRMLDGKLRINPKLPPEIKSIAYPISWKGNSLKVSVSHTAVTVQNQGEKAVNANIFGRDLTIEKDITVKKS